MHAFPAILQLLALASAALGLATRAAAEPLRVVVTIAPLAGIVRPLLPPDATVTTLITPGASEHGHELTPKDTAALAQADLVLYVGLGLEPKIEAVLALRPSPTRRVVCFAQAVGLEPTPETRAPAQAPAPPDGPGPANTEPQDDHTDHDHEHNGDDHHHGPIDPHLWLDLGLVQKLVPVLDRAVLAAAADRRTAIEGPAHDKARADFVERLTTLDEKFRTTLAALPRKTIVTHHNAFSRLAERYGLTVSAVIRASESREPTPGEIAQVVKAVRDHGVHAIFVEPQFDAAVARRIAQAAGAKVGTLDPLGTGDYVAMMESNLASLESNLRD